MEFQAVVMALGKGSRMTDVTNQCAKPLLPVGGMPMIWYPLRFLEKSGFQEAIVLTGEDTKVKLKEMIQAGKLKTTLELNIINIPDEEWGTAESLHYIHAKIKSEILVISCDLILDVTLNKLVNLHRLHNASLTAFFAPIPQELKEARAPGYKGKQLIEHDFIGMDNEDSRLLFFCSEADLEESLTIKSSLLVRHPNMVVHSQLMDAHLYLMKKWVVDYLCKCSTLTSLKGELIPHLIEKQFEKRSNEKDIPDVNASVVALNLREDIYSHAKEDEHLTLVQDLSSWNGNSGSNNPQYVGSAVRCYACVVDNAFCLRANTLAAYFEANKQALKRWPSLAPGVEAPKTDFNLIKCNGHAQIDSSSVVGTSSTLEDKVTVKSSVVGPNCNLGEKVKLINCLLMANVTVKSGCVLEGSIICDGASIGQDCKLKDCLVAAGQKVEDESKISHEVISDASQMMEIV